VFGLWQMMGNRSIMQTKVSTPFLDTGFWSSALKVSYFYMTLMAMGLFVAYGNELVGDHLSGIDEHGKRLALAFFRVVIVGIALSCIQNVFIFKFHPRSFHKQGAFLNCGYVWFPCMIVVLVLGITSPGLFY